MNSKSLHQGREAGFTIVELLVAIIVGAIFVSSLALIINNQAHLAQQTRDAVMGNAFAEQEFESLRSAGFLTLSDSTTDLTSQLPSELKAPRSASLVISSFNPAIKKVVLTITYSDQGIPLSHSYTTFIGELGVGQY